MNNAQATKIHLAKRKLYYQTYLRDLKCKLYNLIMEKEETEIKIIELDAMIKDIDAREKQKAEIKRLKEIEKKQKNKKQIPTGGNK